MSRCHLAAFKSKSTIHQASVFPGKAATYSACFFQSMGCSPLLPASTRMFFRSR